MTSIQYINHASLLINDGENLLLTDPWYDSIAFGRWLPAPPPCIPPTYLVALAENNSQNFHILISSPEDDHCDDNFLKLFPKNINIIIPEYESPWFENRIRELGFNKIFNIGKKEEISNINFRFHPNKSISIETADALVIHSSNSHSFSEECMISINKHIEEYICRVNYKKISNKKILLAAQLNISQEDYPFNYSDYDDEEKYKLFLTKTTNKLCISAINMGVKHLLCYGGHANYFIDDKKIGGFKDYNFHKELIKNHLVEKINFLDVAPGDKFDFDNVYSLFDNFKYTESTLKQTSQNIYNEISRRR